MNIEVYTPGQDVKEWLITFVKDAIVNLHQQHNEISRAEIHFKDRLNDTEYEKTCEITLSIFQNSIAVSGLGANFDEAAKKAVADLDTIVKETFKTNAEPPDEIVSTVNV